MKIEKKPLVFDRLRKIDGGFGYIPNKFLTGGFFASLSQHEKLVYFLLVLVSDRNGMSYYSQDKMSTLLELSLDDFIDARNGLIKKSLIAFDGLLFQVLSLPEKPVIKYTKPLESQEDFMSKDRLTIRKFINHAVSQESEKQIELRDG